MRMPIHATLTGRLLASAALALALAGCAGNSQGTFGAPGVDVEPGAGQQISETPVAGVGGTGQAAPALTVGSGPDAVEYSCPMLDVRPGAGAWQLEGNGGLRVQGSLGQIARECAIVGNNLTMKVGMEGRLVLGDKGAPGVFNVPIRIAVVQEGPNPQTITTKFFVVPVNIPAGESQMLFSVVEDQISFPLTRPEQIERYVVYVGFDPRGEASAPRTTTPRPARPRPAATPATSSAPAASPTPAASPAPAASPTPAASPAPAATSGTGTTNGSDSGGFAAPPSGSFGPAPSTGTFGPPPATFGPPPTSSSQ